MYVDWRFLNFNQAFAQAVGTSSQMLLVYSDVVQGNAVGDKEHPLIQQVAYKDDGSFNFEPQQVQWMPLGRRYLDVIEVQIGSSQGVLVDFGSGKTIVTDLEEPYKKNVPLLTLRQYDHGSVGAVERRV